MYRETVNADYHNAKTDVWNTGGTELSGHNLSFFKNIWSGSSGSGPAPTKGAQACGSVLYNTDSTKQAMEWINLHNLREKSWSILYIWSTILNQRTVAALHTRNFRHSDEDRENKGYHSRFNENQEVLRSSSTRENTSFEFGFFA